MIYLQSALQLVSCFLLRYAALVRRAPQQHTKRNDGCYYGPFCNESTSIAFIRTICNGRPVVVLAPCSRKRSHSAKGAPHRPQLLPRPKVWRLPRTVVASALIQVMCATGRGRKHSATITVRNAH